MNKTLGFDVYGTLIDTHGVILELKTMIGDEAPRFSQVWREKQLEYTFRRGLMGKYQNFGVCTRDALDHTAQTLGHHLTQQQKQTLIAAYSTLPAFDDVVSGLEKLKSAGHRLYAFSNGQQQAVNTVLTNAGINQYFIDSISVDSVGSFKPDPMVYEHFINATHSQASEAWLISSNGFDVIGAVAFGMKAAWIQRSPAIIFDPWEYQPTIILDSLHSLEANLKSES